LDLFSKHLEIESFIPHTWLQITLTEGKFHQVRKMVRAIGHKCKRLIRLSIEDLMLGDLQPNKAKELDEKNFFALLRITDY
jgi:23S rRNA pseudouridine2457 synthase